MEPWFPVARAVVVPPLSLWFRWRFEDLDRIPREGPAIIACNHISYLDPLANAYATVRAGRRPRFLAKDGIFKVPFIGQVMRGVGQIPVDREIGAPDALRRATKALTEDQVVVIYPEGTVTKRPDGMPMQGRSGVVRLSLASGVPIIPMASWGSQDVWQKEGRGSLQFGRPVWLKAGEPIDLSARQDEADDREALRAMTDQVISSLTDLAEDLRNRYPVAWTPESVEPYDGGQV